MSKIKEVTVKAAETQNTVPLGALIAELIGTFILTIILIYTAGSWLFATLIIIILSLVLSKLSGGHVNPLVTLGMFISRQIGWVKAAGFIIAQFIGAALAVVVADRFMKAGVTAETIAATGVSAQPLFQITIVDGFKPFMAELVGAMIFGFGVAAAVFTKKEGFDAAFTIGGSLLLGLLVSLYGSSAVINPAVAFGLGAFNNFGKSAWGVWSYGVAPCLGGVAGMLLYKLLQEDILTISPRGIKK